MFSIISPWACGPSLYFEPFRVSSDTFGHRRSQWVQWVHLHPQGGKKNFLA